MKKLFPYIETRPRNTRLKNSNFGIPKPQSEVITAFTVSTKDTTFNQNPPKYQNRTCNCFKKITKLGRSRTSYFDTNGRPSASSPQFSGRKRRCLLTY